MKKLLLAAIAAISLAACGTVASNAKTTNATSTSSAKPIELTSADFAKKVADVGAKWNYLGDRPCVIDFYATWCGPCKAIAPSLAELAAQYGDQIYIYKIDVDKEPLLAAAFGVQSIPTLLFVPMSGEPIKSMGAMSKADMERVIKSDLLKK